MVVKHAIGGGRLSCLVHDSELVCQMQRWMVFQSNANLDDTLGQQRRIVAAALIPRSLPRWHLHSDHGTAPPPP
jgi:hypothetical protein